MESIVEFALYTWVVVSILAVLVQLVRMLRYRRANAARSQATETVAGSDTLTGSIDQLGARQAPTATLDLEKSRPVPSEASKVVEEPVVSSTAATTAPAGPPTAPPPPTPPPSISIPSTPPATPERPAEPTAPPTMSTMPSTAPTPGPRSAPAPTTSAAPDAPAASSDSSELSTEPSTTPTSSTLADVLSGVRLPWNLLPTVDESREPANDRVALITSEGEPADVGADVADELERLGFVITTRGEDTAVATRGHHVLGLQIIPDAANAVTNGKPRFPSAAASSVALDIWIES